MTTLLDTNIISELVRPKPDGNVTTWVNQQTGFYISVISLEEIYYGLRWKPNVRVEQWLERFIERYCHVLTVTDTIAKHAGTLRGQFQHQGDTRTQADMLIAATAYVHKLTLATRNEKDFTGCGIEVVNPFS
jgi:predicted nucleic acid-binding protein